MAIPPHHPHTLHLSPYWFNNSTAGLITGKARGFKWADQDMNCDSQGVFWGCHWGVPQKDGYTWLWTGEKRLGKEVRIRDPHPHKAIKLRTTENVSRLRRGPTGFGKAWRLTRASVHAIRCQQYGMVMCGEAKSSDGFEKVENWLRFRHELDARGVRTFYPMTLSSLPGWYHRLEAAQKAGFETALLPHTHKPADWAEKKHVVDALWGGWD